MNSENTEIKFHPSVKLRSIGLSQKDDLYTITVELISNEIVVADIAEKIEKLLVKD